MSNLTLGQWRTLKRLEDEGGTKVVGWHERHDGPIIQRKDKTRWVAVKRGGLVRFYHTRGARVVLGVSQVTRNRKGA